MANAQPADPAPLVSLVTPTFNQAAFLAGTIESVLAQTYPAIDYRVIDDGSTDATPAVLARYAGRVASERQANQGQAATLNRAWGESTGKYLAYLSSDDLLLPHAVAAMVDMLETHPHAVCAFPQAHLIDARDRVLKRNVCAAFDLAETVVGQECRIGPGAVFRAKAFRAVGGWRTDLRLAPDREFWMRLAAAGDILFVPRPLAHYRLHRRATSYARFSVADSCEYLRVLDDYFARACAPAIAARRNEAYARAHLLVTRNALRAGDLRAATEHWRIARALNPPLASPATFARLARAAAGKPLRLVQSALFARGRNG